MVVRVEALRLKPIAGLFHTRTNPAARFLQVQTIEMQIPTKQILALKCLVYSLAPEGHLMIIIRQGSVAELAVDPISFAANIDPKNGHASHQITLFYLHSYICRLSSQDCKLYL